MVNNLLEHMDTDFFRFVDYIYIMEHFFHVLTWSAPKSPV